MAVIQRSRYLSCYLTYMVCLLVLVLGGMEIGLFSPPRYYVNLSASMPPGVYRVVSNHNPTYGDIVLYPPPKEALDFGYVKKGMQLMKPIAALPGDQVCAEGSSLLVNQTKIGMLAQYDRKQNRLHPLKGCRIIGSQQLFTASTYHKYSYDGRYHGPLYRSDITAFVEPFWTWGHKEEMNG